MKTPHWTTWLCEYLETVYISLYCDGEWECPRAYRTLALSDVVSSIEDYCPGDGKLKIEFLGANHHHLYTLNGGKAELLSVVRDGNPGATVTVR